MQRRPQWESELSWRPAMHKLWTRWWTVCVLLDAEVPRKSGAVHDQYDEVDW